MTLEQWIIATGATWYISFAVTSTHGPMDIFERLRKWRGGRWHGRTFKIIEINTDQFGKQRMGEIPNKDGLLDCIVCLSYWVALGALWLVTGRIMPLEAFAVAAISLWVHGYTGWRLNI